MRIRLPRGPGRGEGEDARQSNRRCGARDVAKFIGCRTRGLLPEGRDRTEQRAGIAGPTRRPGARSACCRLIGFTATPRPSREDDTSPPVAAAAGRRFSADRSGPPADPARQQPEDTPHRTRPSRKTHHGARLDGQNPGGGDARARCQARKPSDRQTPPFQTCAWYDTVLPWGLLNLTVTVADAPAASAGSCTNG